jgi:hypothetical protein
VKSITALPPFAVPCAQLRDIYDLLETIGLSAKLTGASGTVNITAPPLPSTDSIDAPYRFKAVILAQIYVPQGRENGVDMS